MQPNSFVKLKSFSSAVTSFISNSLAKARYEASYMEIFLLMASSAAESIISSEGLIKSISNVYKSTRRLLISSMENILLKTRTLVISYMSRSGAMRIVWPAMNLSFKETAWRESFSSMNHLITTEASIINITYVPGEAGGLFPGYSSQRALFSGSDQYPWRRLSSWQNYVPCFLLFLVSARLSSWLISPLKINLTYNLGYVN